MDYILRNNHNNRISRGTLMPCGRERPITNRGRTFSLCKDGVQARLQGVTPKRIQKYGAVISGMEFPVRQAVAVATGTPDIEWTPQRAYSVLQGLGFQMRVYE